MSIVTKKGQATIPKRIRDYLGVKPGETEVEFIVVDQHVELIAKHRSNPFDQVRGITQGKLSTDEILEMTRG